MDVGDLTASRVIFFFSYFTVFVVYFQVLNGVDYYVIKDQ